MLEVVIISSRDVWAVWGLHLTLTVRLPLEPGVSLPPDGIVRVDISVRDGFGRGEDAGRLVFTEAADLDSLMELRLEPAELIMGDALGSTRRLGLTAEFERAGAVDFSGAGRGVIYEIADLAVATVTAGGLVVALLDGETTVSASLGGVSTTARLVVQSGATLESLHIDAEPEELPGVGTTGALRLFGHVRWLPPAMPACDDPINGNTCAVDLTASPGTLWSSQSPEIINVRLSGQVTGVTRGTGTVQAEFGGLTATHEINVVNGRPTVSLTSPPRVLRGQSFIVDAIASDDLGVVAVEFQIGGVAAGRFLEPPYRLDVQAPPSAGSTLRITAVAEDADGLFSEVAIRDVSVVADVAPSELVPIIERPGPGARLVRGVQTEVAVTSGDWLTESLSFNDFRDVALFADEVLVGRTSQANIEQRVHPEDGRLINVPVWRIPYRPDGAFDGGRQVVFRVRGTDQNGRTAESLVLAVHIVPDQAPVLNWLEPYSESNNIGLVAGRATRIAGRISDDTLVQGARLELLVDGLLAAPQQVVTVESVAGGALAGSATFGFDWTPGLESVGQQHELTLQAIDQGGHTVRVGRTATILDDLPPQIAIQVSPGASVFAGETVRLTAAVISDDPVEVTWSIITRPDGQPASVLARRVSPPYTFNLPVGQGVGPWTIRAEARDGRERAVVPSDDLILTVMADDDPPVVSILQPISGAQIAASAPLVVTVEATDASTVESLELLRILEASSEVLDTAAPQEVMSEAGASIWRAQFIVDPSAWLPAGDAEALLRLGARGTDAANQLGYASEVTVTLVEDEPPTISFIQPTDDGVWTRGGQGRVTLEVADDVAVAQVELLAGPVGDEISLGCEGGAAPPCPLDGVDEIQVVVDVPDEAGPWRLLARVTDSSGQITEAEQTVAFQDDVEAPHVGFVSPADQQRLRAGAPVTVAVQASDNVAELNANSLALTIDGQAVLLGANGPGRWEAAWVPSLAAGLDTQSAVLEITATDGVNTSTQRIEVEVVRDAPPRVRVVDPAPGTWVREGEPIRLWVLAEDDDAVATLEPRSAGVVGAALPYEVDGDSPMAFTVFAPVSGQDATVGVRATDTAGQQTIADIAVTLIEDETAPEILSRSPDGSPIEVAPEGQIRLAVAATDNVRVAVVRATVGGNAPIDLQLTAESFPELLIENPVLPGAVLVAKSHEATFEGELAAPAAAGTHSVVISVLDAAGNESTLPSFDLVVVEPSDNQAPTVVARPSRGFNQGLCVGGEIINLEVTAVDDRAVTALTLTVDGQSSPLDVQILGASRVGTTSLAIPAYDPGLAQQRLTLVMEARDAAGNTGEAIVECDIVADLAPTADLLEPDIGPLVRGHLAWFRATFVDDAALSAWGFMLSSLPGAPTQDGWAVANPPQADPLGPHDGGALELRLSGRHLLRVDLESGALAFSVVELPDAAATEPSVTLWGGLDTDVAVDITNGEIIDSTSHVVADGDDLVLATGELTTSVVLTMSRTPVERIELTYEGGPPV